MASQTMEHSCFEHCVKSVEASIVSKGTCARLVIDGDVGLGARALDYFFVSEIGLDLRHISSTFKKDWLPNIHVPVSYPKRLPS